MKNTFTYRELLNVVYTNDLNIINTIKQIKSDRQILVKECEGMILKDKIVKFREFDNRTVVI